LTRLAAMSEKKLPVLGFIGLGIMGQPMVANLLAAGYPVQVYNRTPSRAEGLIGDGATACSTPAQAADGAQFIITMVSDTPDVEEVLFGRDGVSEGAATGSVVIDMSSIRADSTRDFAGLLRERGIDMLDAPVSGGDVGAINGTLTIMVGGTIEVYTTALPIFDVLGSRSVLVGPHGAGQATKSCNQILVTAALVGVCEALTFARAANLDLHKVVDAVSGGAAQSWQLENLGRSIIDGNLDPGFMIDLLSKDLGIICDIAEKEDVLHQSSAAARSLFASLQEAGKGALGTQALILAYEKKGKP
jgi:3-hydroxyisobutyrate dehydrogenase-like beta-hydroxyacid dehydrogenase